MENKEIIKLLKLTASLLELHSDPEKNEEAFKIRAYTNAIFNLERFGQPVAGLSFEEICKIEGIGKSMASTIEELIKTGSTPLLDSLTHKTPPGILDMLKLKGIGPKKIRLLWDELKIETIAELLEACEEGKVRKLKGFGEKTEESIKQSLEFISSSKGKLHYATAESLSKEIEQILKEVLPEALLSVSGTIRRKLEIIENIEFVIGFDEIVKVHEELGKIEIIKQDFKNSGPFTWKGNFIAFPVPVTFHISEKAAFYNQLLLFTGSEKHLSHLNEAGKTLIQLSSERVFSSEKEVYEAANLPFIEPELREGYFEFKWANENKLPDLIEAKDLKGVIHSHSTYSDGKNSIKEMAEACIAAGFEYLGISDHSRSAFYANGMEEYRILQQHQEIELLNSELAPFKIFKGIESDILNDGTLDYDDEFLSRFDFVIASIHSNLKMDINKATSRLIKAISNPYTTILGHATGRLLLRREGYSIDHKAIIDACAEHGVIIEINANPNRLDIDWRWIQYALEKNVLLSINPDAHEVETINNMYYGVCVARKGGLMKEYNFNSFSREEVEKHFLKRKALVKI